MIESVLSFTLLGRNEQLDPALDVFQTVFVQQRSVTASIALASYSQGFQDWQPGWAGAFITKAGVSVGPNKTDNLPLDPRDVNRTQIHIKKCVFVTFRLVMAKAEARATALVFVEGAPVQLSMKTRSAYLFDKGNGTIKGIHHVAFPDGQKLPSDALFLRRVRECAAESWRMERGRVGVVLARDADAIFTSGVLDKRGRRIAAATVAATVSQLPTDVAKALKVRRR